MRCNLERRLRKIEIADARADGFASDGNFGGGDFLTLIRSGPTRQDAE
jgi:hypothetical protein